MLAMVAGLFAHEMATAFIVSSRIFSPKALMVAYVATDTKKLLLCEYRDPPVVFFGDTSLDGHHIAEEVLRLLPARRSELDLDLDIAIREALASGAFHMTRHSLMPPTDTAIT